MTLNDQTLTVIAKTIELAEARATESAQINATRENPDLGIKLHSEEDLRLRYTERPAEKALETYVSSLPATEIINVMNIMYLGRDKSRKSLINETVAVTSEDLENAITSICEKSALHNLLRDGLKKIRLN